MHHLYPSGKGDPLCPLGFHPQVRWPTRCKRCFRDYKEHGGRKKDDEPTLRKDEATSSSPSLSIWSTTRKDDTPNDIGRRSWTSTTNMAAEEKKEDKPDTSETTTSFFLRRPASWTSTPDLGNLKDDTHAHIPTVSITLPRRKPTPSDTGQTEKASSSSSAYSPPSSISSSSSSSSSTSSLSSVSSSSSTASSTPSSLTKSATAEKSTKSTISEKTMPIFNKSDSLATRARKMKAAKEASGAATAAKKDAVAKKESVAKKDNAARRIQVKELKAAVEEPSNHDVQFLIQVKSKTFNNSPKSEDGRSERHLEDDVSSIAGTETTDTTLVDRNENELQEQIDSLKQELETMKYRCEKAEREKSDILLRRLAEKETTTSKTTASEMLKLQQRCNEMQAQLEDLQDDKKSLSLKVKELESEIDSRPTPQSVQKLTDELRSKLLAAETLCEELMDENEDMKKELRDMEEEMEEMQDNFREDQADEYSSLKKELEQTTKNCRILSFKLRKTERKVEQLEIEKGEAEKKLKEVSDGQSVLDKIEKIKHLEQELSVSNEVSLRLQKELDEMKTKVSKVEETNGSTIVKKKAPMLSSIGKNSSADGKMSRASLTRGGSQDDPVQLLRDLQDSLEREADLREQLKFAEEEAQSLRKKVSRVEDDNESLVLQLKKMATKARSRKLSPTPNKMTPEPHVEKDEGISDDDDPAELRLLLELSEQEASVLRRKTEELEMEAETMKQKMKDLQEKVNAKAVTKKTLTGTVQKSSSIHEQKLKVLEDETTDLRKKLIEKERDCERLHAELSVTQKRSKGMQKSKSLDGDQQTLDLRRQLQVIEQEAVVLRTKIQSLETENEKLNADNKKLSLLKATKKLSSSKTNGTDNKYIDKIASLEEQLSEATKQLTELKDTESKSKEELDSLKSKLISLESDTPGLKGDLAKLLKPRTPKKPTELTPKSQLKTWVVDLEKELAEYLSHLQSAETTRKKLEEELKSANNNKNQAEDEKKFAEIEELRKQVTILEKKVTEYKQNVTKEKSKQDDLNNNLKKTEETVKKMTLENTKFKSENEKILQEKKKLEQQVDNLNIKLDGVQKKHEETQKALQKAESLQSELNDKRKEITSLKQDLEALKLVEEEKAKLSKQLHDKSNKMSDIETRIKELEEKMKKNERLLSSKKEKISKLEKELESEKQKLKDKETEWISEKESMQASIAAKNSAIEDLNRRESQTPSTLASLQDELSKTKAELVETKCNFENMSKSKKNTDEKLTKLETELKSEKSNWEKKSSGLESDLQAEKKKVDRMKATHEKEQKNRELELSTLKMKIHSLEQKSGGGNEKISTMKQEYEDKLAKLNKDLAAEKQEYEDLTAKYEILEEEHVVTKAQLVMEKEAINSQLKSTKEELTSAETELRNLRDTYNNKQDTWIKEKLSLEDQMKDLKKKLSAAGPSDTLLLERTRLKSALEEKSTEVDQLRRESEVIEDQLKNLRKENEDLKQKLDDYDKVSKVQRNMTADSSAMDKEMIQLKNKLSQVEKSRKADLAECKMRYDSQVAVISEELQSLQSQVMRFKRERDTYKHMLEGAQKTLGDLKMAASKSERDKHNSIPGFDEVEEQRMKLATLEQQISCMEDELSEARLESSKLKTELVSERSSWEVKLSEMRSKINELEEDRLISSGRTKVAGLRTRMELAWHKEREEQTRLLQETSTLARDLRQTLFEVERERDKERLEAKRKQEQLKKTAEEEQEENRRKLNELQCDLLELRDAHAKLRTTNEKLRREKERHEREREEFRSIASFKKRSDLDEERRICVLLEQVDTLLKSMPELQASSSGVYTPTPPRRTKSKSRESSPLHDYSRETSRERSVGYDNRADDIHLVIQRLKDATMEIRQNRSRRTPSIRRAASTENDSADGGSYSSRGQLRNGNLNRKSLSLEQTAGQLEQSIWKGDDNSLSSMQSLDAGSDVDSRFHSMDSRLSGGSTQSEMIPGGPDKKKKKSIMGKLRKLTKSRSIEDQNYQPHGGTDSVASDDMRGSKKDLKERLTGMFKRSGSSSRSNSVERSNKSREERRDREERLDSSSMQRPLMRNGGGSSNRPSPSPSDRSLSLNRDVYSKYK